MKEYHYVDATGQQVGPIPMDELKNRPISKTTLVWCTGMPDWVEAQTVEELNFLFDSSIQLDKSSTTQSQSYNSNYQQASSTNGAAQQRGVFDGSMPMPKNWLVESILVTLFCCLPFGIAGILSASKVEGLYLGGDYEGAMRASKDAKKWTTYGFFGAIIGGALYFIFMFGIGMIGALAS